MASLYKKVINGKPYYYLRQMGRVDGKVTMISERYLGSVADIAAAMSAAEAVSLPDKTRNLRFGDVAAVWSMLTDLDVAGIIDEVVGARRSDAGASIGTYLGLAALGRIVEPGSKRVFADFWTTTAAARFTGISASVLDHRKFWNAMHAVDPLVLQTISSRLAARMIEVFDLDVSSVALDMTNFATYIDTANTSAPIAQRGKAKQKRTDLRLVGLGMVVTRTGGIPLVWHVYPGNRPDVTQFPTLIDHLAAGYTRLLHPASNDEPGKEPGGADECDDGNAPAGKDFSVGAMTVVFDAGQNSAANFAHLKHSRLHYVGSIAPSHQPDLLALTASARQLVDDDRFAGVSAIDTRAEIFETTRRVVLTHSPTLHAKQLRSFTDTTLAKAGQKLDDLAATLARGRTRRTREQVGTEIDTITHNSWVRTVIDWRLEGDTPATHRLTWSVNQDNQNALEERLFGKRLLITDHEDWSVADVIAAYRSQSEIEFGFRQLKDPHDVSFSPMHHWSQNHIMVHTFTCVLALQIAHLMRLKAHQNGINLSVRALLDTLAGIGETILIYPSTGGRPKTRNLTTDMNDQQQTLHALFNLTRWAPKPT